MRWHWSQCLCSRGTFITFFEKPVNTCCAQPNVNARTGSAASCGCETAILQVVEELVDLESCLSSTPNLPSDFDLMYLHVSRENRFQSHGCSGRQNAHCESVAKRKAKDKSTGRRSFRKRLSSQFGGWQTHHTHSRSQSCKQNPRASLVSGNNFPGKTRDTLMSWM